MWQGTDWLRHFQPLAAQWVSGGGVLYDGVFNPIWTLPLLAPLFFLPAWCSHLYPFAALGYYAHKRRKWWIIPLTAFSFPFVTLVIYANIDWVVLVGIACNNAWSPLLLTIKPQAGVFALAAMLKHRTPTQRLRLFAPLAVVAITLTLLYPEWLGVFGSAQSRTSQAFNLSPFPCLVPVGVYALYRAYRDSIALAGVIASLCLSPYFHTYSLAPLIALLAERDWRLGLAACLLSWLILVAKLVGLPVVV